MELLQTGALERYRQRDLPALIDLYEGNYLRVMRLLPDLDSLEGTLVSRVAGALNLYATIEERFNSQRLSSSGMRPRIHLCTFRVRLRRQWLTISAARTSW